MKPVHRQRTILCDLLDSLTDQQWSAETLCRGWDAGDIAAHMLVREHEPWASAGLLLPALNGMHTARMVKWKKEGRESLARQLREGPPWLATIGIIGDVQVGEDYIHAEDVRRGGARDHMEGSGADLTPDDGTGDDQILRSLWKAVARFSLQTFGGIKANGVIALSDGVKSKAYRVGGRLPRPAGHAAPAETVTVTGPVGELLLFVTGRRVTDVHLEGNDRLAAAIEASGRRV
ncbi:MAG: maleylpyruvate isomerase family mycothiol-dependent enzyme [Euzebya sp.]